MPWRMAKSPRRRPHEANWAMTASDLPERASPGPGALVGKTRRSDPLRVARAYSAFLSLAALLIYNILFTPNFLSLGTFNANLTQVATIVIVAVGMTFVIATGGINEEGPTGCRFTLDRGGKGTLGRMGPPLLREG